MGIYWTKMRELDENKTKWLRLKYLFNRHGKIPIDISKSTGKTNIKRVKHIRKTQKLMGGQLDIEFRRNAYTIFLKLFPLLW